MVTYGNAINISFFKTDGQVPVVHTNNPSYSGGSLVRRDSPRKIVLETLSQKYPTQNKTGKVAQEEERLPSKHEALCSNPSTIKKQGG
jgi:hypothetical protein